MHAFLTAFSAAAAAAAAAEEIRTQVACCEGPTMNASVVPEAVRLHDGHAHVASPATSTKPGGGGSSRKAAAVVAAATLPAAPDQAAAQAESKM